ncbi:MAG: asparagine synthase (glutamine-hydrolyzing) [Verrucomicrobia bacterium]|nr:asparagine synthase (glutamine-hydrolyzing) [Verrucomicrobiota bacterium]MBI3868393.1 asparagine synthase (glutamine-hydrolyzing) [Verrucomicrobiota bacterium]
MCGIAGWVDFRANPQERALRDMERSIVHRGPDEGSVWLSGPCGLVHRRLRIIDLSPAAAQPMSNEDGRVQIVFNGEIYNFKPLRAELMALGHQFRSKSDTEALVHGYEEWGVSLIARLRGMFAFAIWDEAERRLLLARDRIGKKPLYYRVDQQSLAFGSELDVFKALPGFSPRLSLPGFLSYMEFGYVPGAESILEGVMRLPPGHCATFDAQGLKIDRYASLPAVSGDGLASGSATEMAERLEAIVREAVVCRLESDVPLGCFLSGGVDSSLVSAVAQENLGTRLRTYTVGFDQSPLSEAAQARQVAERLGTDHHELTVSPGSILGEFEAILRGAAEPLGDDSYVPTYLISRETRKFVTVVLSGDGGDELFAGYEKYRQFRKAAGWQKAPLPWGWLAERAWNDRLHKSCAAIGTGDARGLARWLSTLWKRADLSRALLGGRPAAAPAEDVFDATWRRRGEFHDIERWMLTDMETYLEGDILAKVDRANMAVGLEGRSPLLDQEWIREALRWPLHADLDAGGKRVLKRMLARRFPTEWFERPKQGFGMPVEQWFRGGLRGCLEKYTDRARLKRRGLLDADYTRGTVAAHLSGRRNFARKLYAVVAFEAWADRFFGENAALAG